VLHQGVVLEMVEFQYSDVSDMLSFAQKKQQEALLVALDHLQDPQNVGAIIRSAFSLGAHGVIIPKDRACEITPAVIKAAAGATSHLPIAKVTNLNRCLDELKDQGLWLLGTAPEAQDTLYHLDLQRPLVMIIGAEGNGMAEHVAKRCDMLARIPMVGELGSLNASVSGSICMYEIQRQRVFSLKKTSKYV